MQNTDPRPHDTWAEFYEFVYHKTFGSMYHHLTELNLKVIEGLLPKGALIDLGAGTGRLSVPLKQRGLGVTAVEVSSGMVRQFRENCKNAGVEIPVFEQKIADFTGSGADLAIALFTVLSYTTMHEEMTRNLTAIQKSLNPKGRFFFDLPGPLFFRGGRIINANDGDFKREVWLNPANEEGLFTYREKCSGMFGGQSFSYEEEFPIRQWRIEELDVIFQSLGMTRTKRAFPEFAMTGSDYYLYEQT